MNEVRLIKSIIDTIPFTDGAPIHYWDTELKGFGLRVGKKTKAFFVQRDINTKTYVRKVGAYGIFTPDEARKLVVSRSPFNYWSKILEASMGECGIGFIPQAKNNIAKARGLEIHLIDQLVNIEEASILYHVMQGMPSKSLNRLSL